MMRISSIFLMFLALPALAQVPPEPAPAQETSPHQLEISAGFMRGEWKADDVIRTLSAFDAEAAWRMNHWRVSLSARMLTSIREDAGDCEDTCFPERSPDERHDPMGSVTGGWWGEWGGGQAGIALVGKDTDETSARLKIRPSLLFRAGPRSLHLAGSLIETSPYIPAPGRTRLGLGTDLGRFQAWLGAATDETQRIGIALGVRAALSERLALNAGTAISPTPSEFLLIRAGLTFMLGGDPPWPLDAPE
jgi:hypothetical protein